MQKIIESVMQFISVMLVGVAVAVIIFGIKVLVNMDQSLGRTYVMYGLFMGGFAILAYVGLSEDINHHHDDCDSMLP
jgi:hypothetical protein